MINHLIEQYMQADNRGKKAFIDRYILWLKDDGFCVFLNVVFLHSEPDVRNHAVALLVTQPGFALEAIRYLLAAQEEDDSLNTLKYYGGRIAETARQNIDYSIHVPLLVTAYKFGDYRDANWSIAMALSKIIKDNPEAIKLIVQTSKTNLDTGTIASLFSYLRGYTSIDFYEYLETL